MSRTLYPTPPNTLVSLAAAATLLVSLMGGNASAQVPETVLAEGVDFGAAARGAESSVVPCAGNDAGSLLPSTFTGQSNDVSLDTLFLCFGDEVLIRHNRDQRLDGDPDPSTPAGVGYAWYECLPTVDGPTLGSVSADRCLIPPPGTPPPGAAPFIISTDGGLEGDVRFFNDGAIQDTFNGGDPYLVWFAPITFDAQSTIGGNTFPTYENGGSCVSVSTDAAFAMVYLNRITAQNLNVNNCSGSFIIDGGLPEWRMSSEYNIEVFLTSDRSVRGAVTNPDVNAGGLVRFNVPSPGNYTVEIRDGKGCLATSLSADMTGCVPPDQLTIEVDSILAAPGATVCVPVIVTGFQDVLSFQFGIDYDETLLRFIDVQNPGYSPFLASDFTDFGTQVDVIASLGPYTVPDGGVLFEVCFEVLGVEGEFASIEITDLNSGGPREISTTSGTPNVDLIGGGVVITTNNVALLVEQFGFGCGGEDENSVLGRVFGGVAPYTITYGLQGSAATTTVTSAQENRPFVTPANLAPGNYEFVVVDANGNTDTVVLTVADGAELGVNIDPLNELSCFGDMNGALIARPTLDLIEVSNPGGDYTYVWSTTETSQGISGLGVGNYDVTVTDSRGCTAMATRTLTGRPELTATVNVRDASCEGVSDGEVVLNIQGGTPDGANYTITYTDEAGTATPIVSQNLTINSEPEAYTIAIVDANGCRLDLTATVGAQREVSLTSDLTPITCAGADDAQIQVIGTTVSGTPRTPYMFAWTPSSGTNIVSTNTQSTYSNLGQGQYDVTATDADGCVATETFTIVEPTQVQIGLVAQGDESCNPGMDGFVEVSGSGGRSATSGYTFEYRDLEDNVLGDMARLDGLAAGFYRAFVTDESGCIDSFPAPIEVTAPERPLITQLDDAALLCNGRSDGSLTVVAQATAEPLSTIEWSNGGDGATISGLAAGEYIVEVFDVAGCVSRDTALVTEPDPISINSQTVTDPPCFEGGEGVIDVGIAGGTGPYTFQWSNGVNGVGVSRIDGPTVTAGQYEVTVTDANNCPSFSETFTLTDPIGIDPGFDVSSLVAAPCAAGRCEGGITINPSLAGMPGASFDVTWDSGEMDAGVVSSTASQLCPGRIEVEILTVNGGCPAQTFSYDIPAPPPLITSLQLLEDVRCNGESNGRILIEETAGGTPGFTYSWTYANSLTATGVELLNIPAGDVQLEVRDANGCIANELYTIAEPEELQVLLDDAGTLTPTCFGEENGVISLAVSGGNDSQPYTFRWNDAPNRNAPVARDVPAGNYIIDVTDFKGCTDQLDFTLTSPDEIVFTLSEPDPILCFGDLTTLSVVSASGGQGLSDLDYQVSVNGSSFQPVGQEFQVQGGVPLPITVIDPAECAATGEIVIPSPPQITVRLPDEVEVELGDSVRLLPAIFPGGAPILFDSIRWTPDSAISFRNGNLADPYVSPFSETVYTITVTDEDGCEQEASVLVTVDRNRNVFIPNAFSPNGDANNDEFKIFTGPGVRSINYLRVFDRWGNAIFSRDNVALNEFGEEVTWDGTFRGRTVNPDTYVYLAEIEFLDGRVIVYKGDVNVLY